MNLNTLVRLSKQNDPNFTQFLANFAKNWMEVRNCVDPVTQAITCKRAKTCAFLSIFIPLGIMAALIYFDPKNVATGICMFLVAIAFIIVSVILHIRGRTANFPQARNFCEAITILEGCLSEKMCVNSKVWCDGNHEMLGLEAMSMLKKQAKKVEELQSIPWKKDEALRMREKFARMHSQLMGILPISSDWNYYFPSGKTS